MQFRDLKKQYEVLKPQMDKAILDTVQAGTFIGGKPVKQLEELLAAYVGVKHCVTCANGTDALQLVLQAWGVGPGDAVFVPDFTFFASGEVVSFVGATPVFYDVDIDTFNGDPSSLTDAIEAVQAEGKLTPKVVITVDLFGLPANYDAIERIAAQYGLLVLEDSAQGFGGEYNGQRAGSFGHAATTSFFPAKPLGCYGDGGAIFTNDDEMAALLRSLCFHGKGDHKYNNVRIGVNSRLDTLQAAILDVKLQAFAGYEMYNVNCAAAWYNSALQGVVKTPVMAEGYLSSWAQYTIQLPSEEIRDGLQAALQEQGIPTMIYYPRPMHCQTAFEGVKMYVDCPNTVALCKTVLALPMHPYLDEETVQIVAGAIKAYLAK